MKINLLLILALFITAHTNAQAQSISYQQASKVIPWNNGGISFFNDFDFVRPLNEKDISKLKGSPYFNNDFQEGVLITTDSISLIEVFLRYNIYNDKIEFQKENIAFELNENFPAQYIIIGDDTFTKKDYLKNNKKSNSYFKVLLLGSTSLYAQYEVVLMPPKPLGPYNEAKPAYFKQNTPKLYLQKGEQKMLRFSSKKSLLNELKDHQKEINNFIKKEKINIKDTDDLIQLISFYNKL